MSTVFSLGDHVQYNPSLLAAGNLDWRGRKGVIVSIDGPHAGQGDRLFAMVKMDDDGSIQGPVSCAMLQWVV